MGEVPVEVQDAWTLSWNRKRNQPAKVESVNLRLAHAQSHFRTICVPREKRSESLRTDRSESEREGTAPLICSGNCSGVHVNQLRYRPAGNTSPTALSAQLDR